VQNLYLERTYSQKPYIIEPLLGETVLQVRYLVSIPNPIKGDCAVRPYIRHVVVKNIWSELVALSIYFETVSMDKWDTRFQSHRTPQEAKNQCYIDLRDSVPECIREKIGLVQYHLCAFRTRRIPTVLRWWQHPWRQISYRKVRLPHETHNDGELTPAIGNTKPQQLQPEAERPERYRAWLRRCWTPLIPQCIRDSPVLWSDCPGGILKNNSKPL